MLGERVRGFEKKKCQKSEFTMEVPRSHSKKIFMENHIPVYLCSTDIME